MTGEPVKIRKPLPPQSLANLKLGKAGSRKGIPNNMTRKVRDQLVQAFEEMGGVEKLVEWGKANPGLFYQLWVKLLPLQVTGEGGTPLQVQIVRFSQDAVIDVEPEEEAE